MCLLLQIPVNYAISNMGSAFIHLEVDMSHHFNAPLTVGVEGFYYSIGECPDRFPADSCLADYIAHWVLNGNGIVKCFGSFEILLQTIPFIVDAWHKDPEFLDFDGNDKVQAFERRVSSAFGSDPGTHAIFDRNFFDAAVYMWHHLEQR